MGKPSRDKGAAYERRIALKLNAWSGNPGDFRRTPLSGGWDRSRAPGDLLEPDWFPWVFECKNRESWSWPATIAGGGEVWAWWDALVKECAEAHRDYGLLVFTANRQPDYLLVPERLACHITAEHEGLHPLTGFPRQGAELFLLDEWLEEIDPEWITERGRP